jgi:hypothetical protein
MQMGCTTPRYSRKRKSTERAMICRSIADIKVLLFCLSLSPSFPLSSAGAFCFIDVGIFYTSLPEKKKLRGGDGDVSFRFASLTLSLAAAEMNAFITPASP